MLSLMHKINRNKYNNFYVCYDNQNNRKNTKKKGKKPTY